MLTAVALKEIKNANGIVVGFRLKDESGKIADIKTASIIDAMKNNRINISNLRIVDGNKLEVVNNSNESSTKLETKIKKQEIGAKNEDLEDIEKMRMLVDKINYATRVYEQGTDEVITNYEYDKLYDELLELEKKTCTILANSPTINVGYEIVSNLPKKKHAFS